MDERTLKRLEYDKVLEHLARYTISPLGRERVFSLRPVTDRQAIHTMLAQTTQARDLLRLEPGTEFGGWHDIRQYLQRVVRGAVLEPQELFETGQRWEPAGASGSFLPNARGAILSSKKLP